MKKNAALQIIALALAFILVAGVIVGVIFWQNGNISFTPVGQEQTATPGEETPNKEIPAPSIETTISDNEHIRLTMSAAVTAADSNYVEQVLTATVNPSTAEEKGVDWKAEWADGSDSSDLSTYLTITPQTDGSNVCYVRAFAAFDKDIIITVTTRDGGYTATCTVQFVGNPSDIVVDFEGLSPVQDSGWGVPLYEIKTTSDYDFAISFDNIFHHVNPEFVPNYEVSIACFGKVYIDVHAEDDYQQLVALDEIHKSMTKTIQEASIAVSMSGNSVVVDPLATVESFKLSKRVDRFTSYSWTFSSYEDAEKKPYFQITVKETNTGLTETFNVRIVSGVTSVALDNAVIEF